MQVGLQDLDQRDVEDPRCGAPAGVEGIDHDVRAPGSQDRCTILDLLRGELMVAPAEKRQEMVVVADEWRCRRPFRRRAGVRSSSCMAESPDTRRG